MRTAIVYVAFASLAIASCASVPTPTSTPAATPSTVSTTNVKATPSSTLTPVDAPVDGVHEASAEESVVFEYVLLVRELLDDAGSDDWHLWLEAWVDLADSAFPADPTDYEDGIITGLVEIGQNFCAIATEAMEEGKSPEFIVLMMSQMANGDERWPELTMAAFMASVQTLCPELAVYVLSGIEELSDN